MSKVYNKEELQLRINDILSYLRNIIEDPEGAGVYFSDKLADIFMDVLTDNGDSGINKKFGMVTIVNNTIQFFANEEEYNIYLEDPIKNRDLLLGKVTLPSNTSTTPSIPSIPNPNIDLSNYVTLNTYQEILEVKDFKKGIKLNSSPIITYDSTTKSFLFDGNIVVTGGGVFRATLGDIDAPTIMDAIIVDEQTIIKEGGILKINPNIDLGGGIKPEELQPYLEPYAKIDYVANTYATIEDLNNFLLGSDTDTIINKWKELETFLSGLSESDDLATLLLGKANKATTLSGYGITDAYTNTEIDTILLKYVRLEGTAQDIKVRHNFTDGLKIGGLPIYKSQEDVIYIDSNVVISKGLTVRGTDGTTVPSIWESIPFDNTMKWDGSQWSVVGGGGGGVADSVSWENVTGKPTWIGSTKPTYTPQEIGALPIAGGKNITGDFSIDVGKRILVDGNNLVGTRVFGADTQNPRVILGNIHKGTLLISNADIKSYRSGKEYTILDSSNYSNYALPTSGGTVNGSLRIGGIIYPSGIKYNGSGKIIWHNDETNYFIDCPNGVLTYKAYYGHSFLGGNISVGGTTADEKLHVHGNILATGGITARYTSDERLKTNLRPINAGKMILSLGRVREFEYIDSEVEKNNLYKGSHIGLIYQDVKGSALSKMCFEREDGYGSLNYWDTSLKALLVGVAQEHEIRFTKVEQDNQALKEENRALRKEIEYLKQRVV